MELRVRLDLHLDAFGLAVGGAWSLYDAHGRQQAAHVLPGFPTALSMVAATTVLLTEAEIELKERGMPGTLF